jgi:hypothetical protein
LLCRVNEAVIDVDGVIVGTTGECKDISYQKTWGYQRLSASTKESRNNHQIDRRHLVVLKVL